MCCRSEHVSNRPCWSRSCEGKKKEHLVNSGLGSSSSVLLYQGDCVKVLLCCTGHREDIGLCGPPVTVIKLLGKVLESGTATDHDLQRTVFPRSSGRWRKRGVPAELPCAGQPAPSPAPRASPLLLARKKALHTISALQLPLLTQGGTDLFFF